MARLSSCVTRRRCGGAAMLLVLAVLATLALSLFRLPARAYRHPHSALQGSNLGNGRNALLLWAGARLTQAPVASLTPPGFLPYPDRNGDGNYDGTSDCLSGTGLERHIWRIGKLPFRGERLPCESRDHRHAEASATAALPALRAMASLDVREYNEELLWYAASVNILDDDVMGQYPDISVASLMRRREGWLTLCTGDGRLVSTDVAFVVIAPGPPLRGQVRRGAAPGRQQFLDGMALTGEPPCNNALESNADDNTVFIVNTRGARADFNDELGFVSRNEYISALAIAQARHLARLLQQGPFPYAAAPGTTDGRCIPQLLSGSLPLQDNAPHCLGLPAAPPYLTAAGSDYSHAQYTQIHYALNVSRDLVTLSFRHCAMRFYIRSGGFSYAPGQC